MHFNRSNRGSVLAISLVILTAITLISISSLQRSGLQTRMLGNVLHKENNFHNDNNYLEGAYQYYYKGANKNDPSTEATTAFEELYEAANSDSELIGNIQVYDPISTDYESNDASAPNLTLESNIQFKGKSRAEGNSESIFKYHNYDITSSSVVPGEIGNPDRIVSSQTIGIKFLAPAG